MALMDITVVPIGTGSTSVGTYVAELAALLRREGVPFRLTDMGTHVEGPAEELFRLAARLHEAPFAAGARRVTTVVKVDDRRDREVHLGDKVRSVEERLR
ncbi:MTH1187 family thiamine-binding protein [Dissulfurirhabdus thermomarina]|uniref:MTH1187 family thiamine-binding protein n=1 Tax=Dissulfurirhabdus thermomarina TaxID=1765737 RepID=A0A6N9TMP5_DISTH|nr:MTH1187 family thiamine-binding protein [Dissulfurirhabdus thermomarina]NDY41710.1 MTH1187 family thiamine-binding protein [Dissulfurirhabdus thermomarina]NMX23196.1 MTH1187 family thiamine-binding protein [Dissulfurirhabdus thermomarina]